ncbi:MAG TPA: hypothetical protein VHB48_00965 [Chitinophagaceae bacterium]|nr:hypothetical protein [Chitinophagaceae bacterium]
MRWLFILGLLVATQAHSQCKTYMIGVRKDTLNCTDYSNMKQGKWVVNVPAKYGNPGYSEEGIFLNDKKEGTWRKYSAQGDILAIENYRWGQKDGICDYYTLMGLEHEESWKATNPDNPYDTIPVPTLEDPDKIVLRVIKVDASTTPHGRWTYYNPETGLITKQETYVLGQQVDPLTYKPTGNTKNKINPYAGRVPAQLARRDSSLAKKDDAVPDVVKAWEKKNSGKKKIKVRDGATGN